MTTSTAFRAMSACLCFVFASTSAVSAMCTGSVVPTPQFDKPNIFSAAFATGAEDLWVAGSLGSAALLEHWNGNRWNRLGLPPRVRALEDISGLSSSDIWAVGYASDDCGSVDATAVHWDGIRWTLESPNVCADIESNLTSVTEVKPNDVWAVGVDVEPGRIGFTEYRELALNWTGGNHWAGYYIPFDPETGGFSSIRADKANDVWALGTTVSKGSKSYDLIYHWSGRRWYGAHVKNPGLEGSLSGLAVLSAKDVWAVGSQRMSKSDPVQPLIMHWNGASWNTIPHASALPGSTLASVVAISPNDLWAVGWDPTTGSHVEHWDGGMWATVPIEFTGLLTSIGLVSGTQSALAVGHTNSRTGPESLGAIFHC